MKAMKKRVMGLLLLAVLLMATFGISVQADELYDVGDYYYVSVGVEVSAGMRTARRSTPIRSGIGGEIEDWGQVVAAGNTVSASLVQKKAHSLGAPNSSMIDYTWQIYNANDQPVGYPMEGGSLYIPSTYSGGHLVVTAHISQNGNWEESTISAKVEIG